MLQDNPLDLQYYWGKIGTFNHENSFKGVKFSKDGNFVVTIGEDNSNRYITVFNSSSGNILAKAYRVKAPYPYDNTQLHMIFSNSF